MDDGASTGTENASKDQVWGQIWNVLIWNVEFKVPSRHQGAVSGREAGAGGLRWGVVCSGW